MPTSFAITSWESSAARAARRRALPVVNALNAFGSVATCCRSIHQRVWVDTIAVKRDVLLPGITAAAQLTIAAVTSEDEQRRRRGYWLRLARQRAGLTLKQVAVEMGYALWSQTTIRLWEEGRRDPSDIQLSRMARIYRVPVSIFAEPRPTDREWLDERVPTIDQPGV